MKIDREVSELWRVENLPLSLTWPMAYTTACTTIQAVIIVTWDVTVSDTLAQSYVHETSPDSRRSSRGGSRKEKKQVLLTKPIVLVCSNRGTNDGGHQQGRDKIFLCELGMRITQSTDDHARAPSSFSDYPF